MIATSFFASDYSRHDVLLSAVCSLRYQANYGGLVLWILSLYASKCAAIVFMSRFAQPGRHEKEILALLVVVAVLGFSSLLALTVDCRVVSSIYYWDFPLHRNYCPQPVSKRPSAGLHMKNELIMFVVPVSTMAMHRRL